MTDADGDRPACETGIPQAGIGATIEVVPNRPDKKEPPTAGRKTARIKDRVASESIAKIRKVLEQQLDQRELILLKDLPDDIKQQQLHISMALLIDFLNTIQTLTDSLYLDRDFREQLDKRFTIRVEQRLLDETIQKAAEVLGSREEGMRWLGTPVRGLDFATPISLLGEKEGMERVSDILGQMEHGVW